MDTYCDANGDEVAWLGLVPFEIKKLVIGRSLSVPNASSFLETNVRTYVHRDGKDPGVWFFSLDAASGLACTAARLWFGLPYWRATMSLTETQESLVYRSTRSAGPQPSADLEVRLTATIAAPQPGSFEYFLVERYLLYTYLRGRLWQGRVSHEPYKLRTIGSFKLEENLVKAAGFERMEMVSALYSPGVDVDVFRLTPSPL